jgi:hypothetical protein
MSLGDKVISAYASFDRQLYYQVLSYVKTSLLAYLSSQFKGTI